MASNNQDESSKTIGNRNTDLHYSDTLYGYALSGYKHVHMPQWVYPFLDDGVTLTADTTAGSGVISMPIQIPRQLPNTRISGAAASKSGGGDTITISLVGHEY
jgi:hypothetical protein